MNTAVIYALTAALLFGASTPFAKLLVGEISPILLAGLLYLGSGIGLGIVYVVRGLQHKKTGEAPLQRSDIPWLAGAVLAGGVIGPALLMVGLSISSAASSSLLLNLEGVFTAFIAWYVFKENFDRRIFWGMIFIIIGGLFLSWLPGEKFQISWGLLAVTGACLAWAVDNNLTRKVSGGDPVQIAGLKGGIAGLVNLSIAFAMGNKIPQLHSLGSAFIVGFLGYGLSLTFFVLSLRHLGTARTGAYFATAPFIGALLAVFIFHESITTQIILAAIVMGIGVWLHLTEHHLHEHRHHDLEHEHRHSHDDEHHVHPHDQSDQNQNSHSHPHQHSVTCHAHPHYPDLHHRHDH